MAKDRIDYLQDMGFEANGSPQLRELRATAQTLKGCEVSYKIEGLTNVDDLGQLDPQAMTIALFDWIYRLHGQDYERFASSCKVAVQIVKDAAQANLSIVK